MQPLLLQIRGRPEPAFEWLHEVSVASFLRRYIRISTQSWKDMELNRISWTSFKAISLSISRFIVARAVHLNFKAITCATYFVEWFGSSLQAPNPTRMKTKNYISSISLVPGRYSASNTVRVYPMLDNVSIHDSLYVHTYMHAYIHTYIHAYIHSYIHT